MALLCLRQDRSQLIEFGFDDAFLGIDFGPQNQHRLYVKITKDGKRSMVYNKTPINKIDQLKSVLAIDYLSADVLRVSLGEPGFRRRDLDRFLVQYYPEYKEKLAGFNQILKQKQMALKQKQSKAVIQSLNQPFVEMATHIVNYRQKGLQRLQEEVSGMIQQLSFVDSDDISYLYHVHCDHISLDLEDYTNQFGQLVISVEQKELLSAQALVGPHRDDFSSHINGILLSRFFSRGINRLCSILYKLAQLRLLKQKHNGCVLLLLDDALVEIDRRLRGELLDLLTQSVQVIYTTTSQDDYTLLDSALVCEMVKGNLSEKTIHSVKAS